MIFWCQSATGPRSLSPVGVAEAVDHALAAVGGQIQRQAFGPEGLAQFVEHTRAVGVGVVDLVDDQHAAQIARLGVLHHPAGAVFDAAVGIHDDRDGFHRRQRGQRRAAEIGITGSVDEVDVDAAPWSMLAMPTSSEWPRCLSIGSKSETVLPRSTVPAVWIAPPACSRASKSVVLPAAGWPAKATLRMFSVL